MKQLNTLDKIQIDNIKRLAEEKRRELGFIGDTPIANDIFTILEKLNILLLEYPIKSENKKPAFSAALMYSKESDKDFVFIGLNTADYFYKQIFAIAHELYHFYTNTGSHLSRLEEEKNNTTEIKANRFAAEFLLPEKTLKRIILDEFKMSSLEKIKTNTLLRFIARLQCAWWLPYKSLVKRLEEIDAISNEQYKLLYSVDERNGEYTRIGKAINEDVFIKLNSITKNIGTSPKDIEVIIRNFEDDIIDEDKFIEALSLFGKKPEEFGYEINISEEDYNEFNEFFNEEADNEN